MKPIWDKLASMHVNTVIGTVSWELLEPAEGKFDFSIVDAQITEARKRNMRLVLIWSLHGRTLVPVMYHIG
jgi:beta-galactosidase GanA